MFYRAFLYFLKDEVSKVLNSISKYSSIETTEETISYKLDDNSNIEIPYRMYYLDITDLEYENKLYFFKSKNLQTIEGASFLYNLLISY